jgi:competence protein ComEC
VNSNDAYLLKGEIIELPKIMDNSVKVVLQVNALKTGNIWQKSESKIILYLPKDTMSEKLISGDYIYVNPKFNIPQNPKNPHQFNYKKYLQFHLIAGQAFLKSADWVKIRANQRKFSLYSLSQKIRKKFVDILHKTPLTDDELAITQALVLGYKNDMNDNVQQAYSAAGATHVLAVSGLHVGIIFLIIQWLFSFLKTENKYFTVFRVLITLLLIWCYAFITGLSVSVMRAAVMFSFVLIGQLFNRNVHVLNSLAASAFLLLVFNPYYVFQLGFQLSYLAVAGIVIFQPYIAQLWQPQVKVVIWLRDLLSVSLAAQIITLPLTLVYFHQFPVYFLLTNILVIPAAFIILLLGIITLMSFFIHPLVFNLFGIALHFITGLVNTLIFKIQLLPWSVLKDIYFTTPMTIISYTGLVFVIIGIGFRKYLFVSIGLLTIVVLLVLSVLHDLESAQQKQFIVYAVPRYSVYNFIDGRDNIVVTDDKFYSKSKNVDFTLKNNWIALGLNNEKVVSFNKLSSKYNLSNIFRINNINLYVKDKFFYFFGKKIAIVDNQFKIPDKINEKINIDYLIMSKNTSVTIDKLLTVFVPNLIIFDSSSSQYKIKQWINEISDLHNIAFYDVSSQGAFIDVIK